MAITFLTACTRVGVNVPATTFTPIYYYIAMETRYEIFYVLLFQKCELGFIMCVAFG
mgnify:CR=1 FL=1